MLLAATAATAAAAATAAVAASRQKRRRQRTERYAAAAFESLLKTLDANDPDTGSHARRVAFASVLLAQAAGLTPREQRSVERVALFHDIGKIHQALFDIVHDDGDLTDEERERIRTHPRRGAEVLMPLAAFDPALADGVLAHHEQWAGAGYPRGLRGTGIPVAARIVAICDTFDAITHTRRYRSGRSPADAATVIREGAGAQFDPELAALFLKPHVLRRIEANLLKRAAAESGSIAPRSLRHAERRGARPASDDERDVPDVSFRWRDGGPVQRAQDQRTRTPRE